MHAGVYHQTNCTPDFTGQPAEVRVRILIKTHILAKGLGIQTPAFRKRCIAILGSETGNISQLLLNGNLHVMSGASLMVGNIFQLVMWHGPHIGQMRIKNAGA